VLIKKKKLTPLDLLLLVSSSSTLISNLTALQLLHYLWRSSCYTERRNSPSLRWSLWLQLICSTYYSELKKKVKRVDILHGVSELSHPRLALIQQSASECGLW